MSISKASSSAVAPGAKGDLVVGTTTNDSGILAVGANNTVLTADSSTATGLKWSSVSAGGMTLITTGSMASVSTLTLSSISQSYKDLIIDVSYFNTSSTDSATFGFRPNSSTGSYRGWSGGFATSSIYNEDSVRLANGTLSSDGGYAGTSRARIVVFDYTYSSADGYISGFVQTTNQSGASTYNGAAFFWRSSIQAAITSLNFYSTATMQRGTIRVYGLS